MSLNKPTGIILLLIWCLFMGVTAISIGFGAAFPALNQIAGPFVCSNGEMRVDSQTYRPSPGTTVTTLDWQCVDKKTGEAQPVNEMSMFLINGLIYGVILFAIVMIGWWAAKRRRTKAEVTASADVRPRHASPTRAATTRAATSFDMSAETYDMEIELSKLKKLRDEGLITEKDYEQKKLEILSRL